MSGLGHNGGPSMEPGRTWRRHVWTRAREELLPRLPIEVLRGRIRRAGELGLDYRTYASVRASTGRDVIGFLFSNNALRVLRDGERIEEARAARLEAMNAQRLGLAHRPLTPEGLMRAVPQLEATGSAPGLVSWGELRARLEGFLREQALPRDGVLLVAETTLEREWCAAGRLAGCVGPEAVFP